MVWLQCTGRCGPWGQNDAPIAAASVEAYSPQLNTWRAGIPLPHATALGRCVVVQCSQGLVMLLGRMHDQVAMRCHRSVTMCLGGCTTGQCDRQCGIGSSSMVGQLGAGEAWLFSGWVWVGSVSPGWIWI